MAELTKDELKQRSEDTYFPNGRGEITPGLVRDFNEDLIDSLAAEISLNQRLEKTGDASATTVAFTEADIPGTLTSGSTLSVLFGQIKKWFTDLISGAIVVGLSKRVVDGGITTSQIADGTVIGSKIGTSVSLAGNPTAGATPALTAPSLTLATVGTVNNALTGLAKYHNFGNVSGAGWRRIYQSGVFDSRGENILLTLMNDYNIQPNQVVTLFLACDQRGMQITQLASKIDTAFSKIRYVRAQNKIFYIDVYYQYNSVNPVRAWQIGGQGVFTAPTLEPEIPEGYTATEYDIVVGGFVPTFRMSGNFLEYSPDNGNSWKKLADESNTYPIP